MQLLDIYRKDKISARTFNMCRYNGLHSIETILNHYAIYKNFNNLKRCGRKSNEELLGICSKYSNLIEENILNKRNSLNNKISNLSANEKELINIFLKITFPILSIRSQNCLINHLKDNINIDEIYKNIFCTEPFNFSTIKNAGAKTVHELEIFFENLRQFIDGINLHDEITRSDLYNNLFIHLTFNLTNLQNDINPKRLFSLIKYLIDDDKLLNKKENYILRNGLNIFNYDPKNNDQIAQEIKITTERVRQLKLKCISKLNGALDFVSSINLDIEEIYNINLKNDFIYIDIHSADLINKLDSTNFSNNFILLCIYKTKHESYNLIGNIEDVFQNKIYNKVVRHTWKNIYLIKKNLCRLIDFPSLIEDVRQKLNGASYYSFSVNFDSYISSFYMSSQLDEFESIRNVSKFLLQEEFSIRINNINELIFEKNILKCNHEKDFIFNQNNQSEFKIILGNKFRLINI